MPSYFYTAKNKRGKPVSGKLQTDTIDTAATQLMRNGLTPIHIILQQDFLTFDKFLSRIGARHAVTLNHLIVFSRQMYTLMKSGVPITKAIRGLADSIKEKHLAIILEDVAASLDAGHELSAALSQHDKAFPQIVINIIAVGENTGRLDEAFQRIANYLEFEVDTRKKVKAATRYPIIVISAIVVAIAVINMMVIPAFAKVFASLNSELPWQTKVLINTSEFTVANWPYILMLIIAVIMGFFYFIRTPYGHYFWDKYKLEIPLIGIILKRTALARFSRSFAMAFKSGVPLLQTLAMTSQAVSNVYIQKHVLDMRRTVERGDTLTRAAHKTKLFTPLVLQMMAVGDETGEIDRLLEDVGAFYEREVEYDIKRLTDAIEPILLIVMGALVLIVALGVFLPMWELGNAFKPD